MYVKDWLPTILAHFDWNMLRWKGCWTPRVIKIIFFVYIKHFLNPYNDWYAIEKTVFMRIKNKNLQKLFSK